LFVAQAVGAMQFGGGHGEERAHAAVAVHTEHFEFGAAVGLAASAGDAAAAVEVRFHGATIAGLEVTGRVTRIDDLDAEFMAEHARKSEERLTTGKGVQVGAADADTMYPHQRLAGTGTRFGGVMTERKGAGMIESDGEHGGAAANGWRGISC